MMTMQKFLAFHAEMGESGLSQRAFCAKRKVPYHVFTYWRRKVSQRPDGNGLFVELEPRQDAGCGRAGFDCTLPNGISIRVPEGFDGGELRRLARALAEAL